MGVKRQAIIGLILPLASILACSLFSPARDDPDIQSTIQPTVTQDFHPSIPIKLPSDERITSALSPALLKRITAGSASETDRDLMIALAEGDLFPIDGLILDSSPKPGAESTSNNHPFVYIHPEDEVGGGSIVAWYDPTNGRVVEAATGYPLNVADYPGVRIEDSPNGEKLYRYGFAWYPRWERILPEPVIELLEAFYSQGIAHVRDHLSDYQTVARPGYSGEDLQLVQWDGRLITQMRHWGEDLPAPPFLYLPDSGIDIQPQRYEQLLSDEWVVLDDESIDQYLASGYPQIGVYGSNPSRETIEVLLLAPLANPHVYNEMERAIILGALIDDRGPLRIMIDFDINGGFLVPDSGEKELRIAPTEIDVMSGYIGTYLSKFPHEMAHILEARDYPFIDERCWPEEEDMKEPLKYVLEYMWWVQQYPGDAPNWDWEPINSGLTLARLLRGYYPNSDC